MSNHYQGPKGWRPTNSWGDGNLPAPFAVGDVIDVPDDNPGVLAGRFYHGGRWRITAAFSISEGDDWYFRASPMRENKTTDWATISDRLHVLPDQNYLSDVTLVSTYDEEGLKLREEILKEWSLSKQQAPYLAKQAESLAKELTLSGFADEATPVLALADRLKSI